MNSCLRACVLVAVLALSTVGCGGGESTATATGEPISLEELAKAAGTSSEAASGRFAFAMEMSFPGADEPFAFSGEGAFDAASKRASFAVDMSPLVDLLGGLFAGMVGPDAKGAPAFDDPSLWKIEAVQDDDVTYVRFPALAGELPAGKSWIRSEAGRAGPGAGFDFTQFQDLAKNDPREVLDFLRAVSGEIEAVGVEELRGASTTHYRTTIDPREYAKLVPEAKRAELGPVLEQLTTESGPALLPVDVWVDGDGLVRKLAIAFSATQPGTSDSVAGSLTFELYDFGKRVEIVIPPASEVVDESVVG